MANRTKMAEANAIMVLWRRGYSFRRIARELGIHGEMVFRYVRVEQARSKPVRRFFSPATPVLGHLSGQSGVSPWLNEGSYHVCAAEREPYRTVYSFPLAAIQLPAGMEKRVPDDRVQSPAFLSSLSHTPMVVSILK